MHVGITRNSRRWKVLLQIKQMSKTSEKQIKDEEFYNYPFDAEIFHQTFNRYVRRLNTAFIIVAILICAPFIAHAIAWYLEQTKVDITGFLNLWYAGETLLLDLGFPHISFGIFSSGIISVGQISAGLISVGNFSCGVISIGGFGSYGVISIGGISSAGVITIGYTHVYGIIAVATGKRDIHQKHPGGQAFGLIAIGRRARGVYALSYQEGGEGTYLFSPERQDPEAIALFTRWFKKFKDAFVLPAQLEMDKNG